MGSDHHYAAIAQPMADPLKDHALERRLEVGEHQIAAEDQVEGTVRLRRSDILQPEGYALPAFGAQAVQLARPHEGPLEPIPRQLL